MTTLDVYVASTHDLGRLSRFKTAASRKCLGSIRDFSLEEARKRSEHAKLANHKINPLEARRAERSTTLGALA